MFREVTRKKQIISQEECREILRNEKRGVLAVLGDDEYPYAMPMNFLYDEEKNLIYFHGGRTGHKTDALKKHDKVSFCVYDEGFRRDGEWALNIKSVIVFGKISFVEDEKITEDVSRKLSYKYTPDTEYIENEIKHFLSSTLCLEMKIEHMTGKIVNES